MSYRVDHGLLSELKKYGRVKVEACFNCGNCTAICPLSTDATPFPRNNIRLLQLGLKDRILESTDPWLCYYCGECSETCPRGAEPAEAQMALRRWLTAQYDWTGLGARFYTSSRWVIGALLLVAAMVLALIGLLHGPIVTDRVELNTFAPTYIVHIADLVMAGAISLFLFMNVFRMHSFIMGKGSGVKAPLSLYLLEAWNLPYHFLTQKRFSGCGDKRPWINHLILASGYALMFVIIVLFLEWFQTDDLYSVFNPQRWLGYYAAAALIYGTGIAIWGRVRAQRQMHKYSQLSDWLFPILLFLLAVSGLLVHIFRYAGMPLVTYYTYGVHMILVPAVYVSVGPMGKWAHLFYRPLAVYFQAVKERALAAQTAVAAAGAAAN
ncbi:MAG: 4Fe-4S dicluster domain-containing protein [Chloroflexota bacterium]